MVIGVFGPDWSDTGHFYTHLRDDINGFHTHLISQIRYDDNNWHHYKLVIDKDEDGYHLSLTVDKKGK